MTRQPILLINIFPYPKETDVAMANPSAADFPRPLAAVITAVLLKVFSDIASTNLNTAFPYKVENEINILYAPSRAPEISPVF